MQYKEIEKIDLICDEYYLKCKEIILIGYRLNNFKHVNTDYFYDYFYDQEYNVFIGKIKKNSHYNLKEILKMQEINIFHYTFYAIIKMCLISIKDYS